jgi:hypothetical protein
MASHRPTVKPLTPVRDRSEMAGRTAVPALAVAPGTGAAVAEAIGGVTARPSKPRRGRSAGDDSLFRMAFKDTANNSAKTTAPRLI